MSQFSVTFLPYCTLQHDVDVWSQKCPFSRFGINLYHRLSAPYSKIFISQKPFSCFQQMMYHFKVNDVILVSFFLKVHLSFIVHYVLPDFGLTLKMDNSVLLSRYPY